jgi:hypothetical protein
MLSLRIVTLVFFPVHPQHAHSLPPVGRHPSTPTHHPLTGATAHASLLLSYVLNLLPPSNQGTRIPIKNALPPGMGPVHDAQTLDIYLRVTAAVAIAIGVTSTPEIVGQGGHNHAHVGRVLRKASWQSDNGSVTY